MTFSTKWWRSLTVMFLLPTIGCGGDGYQSPAAAGAKPQTIESMQAQFEETKAKIRELQDKVERVVMEIITDMDQDKLDVEFEIDQVEKTTKEINDLRNKMQKRRNSNPTRQEPVT